MVEGEYWYEGSTHTPIEPHCALADFDPTGFLTVWSSTQVAHYLHRDLAKVLGLPTQRIRVIQPVVGGAFGGKSEPFSLEFCAAKLAMITGRPVKILYTREEVFYAHRGRHPMRLHYRTGVKRDGTLTGVDAQDPDRRRRLLVVRAGHHLLLGPAADRALPHAAPTASTRRACSPTSRAADPSAATARCSRASRSSASSTSSPRRSASIRSSCGGRNFLGENTRTVNGMRVTSNGFPECLDAVERASGWTREVPPHALRPRPRRRRQHVHHRHQLLHLPERDAAVGASSSSSTAAAARPCSAAPPTSARASDSVLAYIVCEELGLELRRRARRRRRHRPHPGRPRLATRAARRSWSATPAWTRRASCARKVARGAGRALGRARRARSRSPAASRAAMRDPAQHVHDRPGGVPARRGAVRHARLGRLVPEPQARRRLPRRHDRRLARLLVHRARRRGRVRRRDRARRA